MTEGAAARALGLTGQPNGGRRRDRRPRLADGARYEQALARRTRNDPDRTRSRKASPRARRPRDVRGDAAPLDVYRRDRARSRTRGQSQPAAARRGRRAGVARRRARRNGRRVCKRSRAAHRRGKGPRLCRGRRRLQRSGDRGRCVRGGPGRFAAAPVRRTAVDQSRANLARPRRNARDRSAGRRDRLCRSCVARRRHAICIQGPDYAVCRANVAAARDRNDRGRARRLSRT